MYRSRQYSAEKPFRSLEETRVNARWAHSSALRWGRLAIAFAIVWPLGATLLYLMNSFSLFNLATAYMAPVGMLGMMWLGGSIPRDGMWRMVRGTMMFHHPQHPIEEVDEWVNSCYGVDRVHKFANYCYVFRYKRDATLFKLMWG